MERIAKKSQRKKICKKMNISDKEFSSFQSDVANALLELIEDKDDTEVLRRLDATRIFFSDLSKELVGALAKTKSDFEIDNKDFDCAEDILKINNFYIESGSIH